MNIVLFEPEIPQNTGNIARTCALTGSRLHLIEPLGFLINDKAVRRAGLDYWDLLDLSVYVNFDEFLEKNSNPNLYLMTTHAQKHYSDIDYDADAFLLFGKESAGLPDEIHKAYPDNRFRIPMLPNEHARSLNLSNSVAIVLYEAFRQHQYMNLI